MKKFRIILLSFMLLVVSLMPVSVHAAIADPDSAPMIREFNVYRNIRETGDMLLLIDANIPYASIPTTPVDETYIWRLIDTDGTTELGSAVGYPYNDSGYNENLFAMYWDAADVTALGIVWGTNYTVRLSQNPTHFATVLSWNYTINSGAYSTTVVSTAVRVEIATRIIALGGQYDDDWGLTPTYSLLTEVEAATVLSIYGESFFRGAVNGIQAMCPSAFYAVIRNIEVTDRTWTQEYVTNVTSQWAGTWVETSIAAGEVLFGTTYDMLSILLLLGCCGGLLIGNIMLTGDHWNGLVDVALVGVVGARLALYDFFFLLLVAALCWIYISLKVWFGMVK